eukprot:868793-Rhodomonas_salina.1
MGLPGASQRTAALKLLYCVGTLSACARCGTDMAYGQPFAYARSVMSGTDMAYGELSAYARATRCPVLTRRMVLPAEDEPAEPLVPEQVSISQSAYLQAILKDYASTRRLSSMWVITSSGNVTCIVLRDRCAISDADVRVCCYQPLRDQLVRSCHSKVAPRPICYAMPSTENDYAANSAMRCPSMILRAFYVVSGTDVVYAATSAPDSDGKLLVTWVAPPYLATRSLRDVRYPHRRSNLPSYALSTRRPVLTWAALSAYAIRYAVCGTDMLLPETVDIPRTEIAYGAAFL